MPSKTSYRAEGEAIAAQQKSIQATASKKRPTKKARESGKAIQTGARAYPAPPLPTQHLSKPGKEAELIQQPMYEAPYYKGSAKLENKVAIITGADSGIGRAVALLFAREGADVAVIYLNEDEDAKTTKEAVESEGRKCILIPGNVASKAFCEDAVAQVLKAFGKIDLLVNNSAFQLHADDIGDISEAHFDMTVKTNLYGYFFMAQAVVPHLESGAAIINTGSVTAIDGSKELLDYSLTKGGIHTFTRSLAANLMAKGIRVNAVAPGPVWTPLNPSDKEGDAVAKFGSSTPMGRPAQPEEIAPAYVFLASAHCSSYITGEVIPVIGGYPG